MQWDFNDLPRVNRTAATLSAAIRAEPEHFQVEEVLPFSPSGEGTHAWLWVEKTNTNTNYLAKMLAEFAGVPELSVGFAGLKDRHAVTRQWFSVNLEGITEPDWQSFNLDQCRILEVTRHNRKCRRGILAGNKFTLTLTHVQGEQSLWQAALEQVKKQGFPNYFAEQRFGHNGNNLREAEAWFFNGRKPRQRHQRSMILSAARSWLFNLVLAERLKQQNWLKAVDGDVMMLSGTSKVFAVEQADAATQSRLDEGDISITGAMWGQGDSLSKATAAEIEQQALAESNRWQQALEQKGLSQERRSLRILPNDLQWSFADNAELVLSFFLPAGSYATALLRELAVVSNAAQRNLAESVAITDNKDK
jgi:tRNA pseudouridine13 synthase